MQRFTLTVSAAALALLAVAGTPAYAGEDLATDQSGHSGDFAVYAPRHLPRSVLGRMPVASVNGSAQGSVESSNSLPAQRPEDMARLAQMTPQPAFTTDMSVEMSSDVGM